MPEYEIKPGFHFTPLPPAEAIAFFRAKKLKPAFDYRDVWREEHAFGFTAAKAMQLDVLRAIRRALAEALAGGQTFREFQKNLTPTLQRQGWWGIQTQRDPKTGEALPVRLGSPRRLRTIFWANTRTAYAASQRGRCSALWRPLLPLPALCPAAALLQPNATPLNGFATGVCPWWGAQHFTARSPDCSSPRFP